MLAKLHGASTQIWHRSGNRVQVWSAGQRGCWYPNSEPQCVPQVLERFPSVDLGESAEQLGK